MDPRDSPQRLDEAPDHRYDEETRDLVRVRDRNGGGAMRATRTRGASLLLAFALALAGCAASEAEPSLSPPGTAQPDPTVASMTPQAPPQATPTAQATPAAATPTAEATPTAAATPPVEATPTVRPRATAGADGWIGPELISTRPYGELSLAIDSQGVAHAATVLNDGIFYLTNETGSWTRERLTRPRGYDSQPSIAIDSDDSVHIAFTRWPPDDPSYCRGMADCFGPGPDGVFYLTNRAGSWSPPVQVGRAGANHPSLRVRDGRVHIAYVVGMLLGELGGPNPLRVATSTDGAWADERVGRSWGAPQLELGADGRPHLAWWIAEDLDEHGDGGDWRAQLRYAVGDTPAGSFQVEEVELSSTTDWIEWPHLAIDGIGRTHLVADVWSGDTSGFYYWLRDGSWDGPTALLSIGSIQSIAAPAGALHALVAQYECCVYLLSRRGGAQERRDLLSLTAGQVSGHGVMALDALDRPHILIMTHNGEGDSPELWYAVGPAANR